MGTQTSPLPAAEVPKIISVAKGMYVRQEVDNMGWADMGDYALVVDALEQPATEAAVLAAIDKTVSGLRVRCVLNTHTHYDHTVLNPVFEQLFGSEIINQRTETIPPEGKWLEGSERRALMKPLPCHSREDCTVWFPDDRVLFTGDLFGWGLVPYEGHLKPEKQQLVVDVFRTLIEYDAKHVIPGHGPLCSGAELRRWLAYFDWLRATLRKGVEQGLTGAELVATVPPPEDMNGWWRFVQWKHDDSVKKVAKAAESGWL